MSTATVPQVASSSRSGKAPDRVGIIPIAKIRNNPAAMRGVDRENLEYIELVDSVRKKGVLEPIMVREFTTEENPGEVFYGIINGTQRYNAALDCGLVEIAAKITDKDDAEVEEEQIIANAIRVQTKPYEYAVGLTKLLERKPTMSMTELSDRVSKPVEWLYKMFRMVDKLQPEIGALVDEKKICVTNAQQLAKIKKDEQPEWLDRAMTMEPGEFAANISQRLKDVREARAKGKPETPPEFQPAPHQRAWSDVKGEYISNCNNILIALKKVNPPITTVEDAVKFAIAWCAYMDPESQAEARVANQARVKEREEKAEVRRLEAIKKKEAEAHKTKEELEKKIAEREKQTAA